MTITTLPCGILVADDREPEPSPIAERSRPGLDWFLSLPREHQEAIWGKVAATFPWRGWLCHQGPMCARHLSDLYAALENAGAELGEEYT